MVRLDGAVLGRIKDRVARVPSRKFDSRLPKRLQKDPDEYARRMQRRAAVSVTLCNVSGKGSLLFTVRSHKVGTHAGQVSFPGGHVEQGETMEEASIRELEEEIDMVGRPLGRWSDVRAVTGTMVTPVLVMIDEELDEARLSSCSNTEVEKAFSVPILSLLEEGAREVEILDGRWEMPRFQVGDNPVIWGLTAFILDGVLRDILSPALDI
mmetsp:Transcript_5393/g.8345  ORF Transcript_5393/g.8345 Transcript_5393/m.8345 type:complete len:210 (+) Transcript_5393:404-1033(+)